jgi:large subunit ribosomal protein L31e
MAEERIYVVPLREAKKASRRKRAPKAVKELRSYLERHLKTNLFVIDEDINERIWERGIEKIPSRIRVRVTAGEELEEGEAAFRVSLAE